MEGWWFFLMGGLALGFVLGGEFRHRLWKTDRYWSEQTIATQREHIALLKKRLAMDSMQLASAATNASFEKAVQEFTKRISDKADEFSKALH